MPLPDLFDKRFVKIISSIIFLIVLFYLFYFFADILLMLAISILLSLIFTPIVDFLENKKISRLTSIFIIFILVTVTIIFSLNILIPKVASQIQNLTRTLSIDNIQTVFSSIELKFRKHLPFLSEGFLTQNIEKLFQGLFVTSFNDVTEILNSIVALLSISVIVPFMTFFILKDSKNLIRGVINIIPNKYFEMSYSISQQLGIQLGRFVRGWILDAFFVGLMSGIGLSILQIENAVTIGFIAGVGHLIPYFGPIIGGIPAILISLIQFGDFSMLIPIIIMFTIVYTLDNGFVQPNVFSKSVDMHPLVIIILILLGSKVMGIAGMLLAVPIATVIKTASREIYIGFKNYRIIKL